MFSKKKSFQLLFLAIVILLMSIIIFRDFIFNGYLYLYQDIGSDTINSYYPYYLNFIRALKNRDLSFWFNNLGMGNNVLSMSELLTDPFAVILLAFGEKHLAQGLLVMAIIKIVCAGILFYIYVDNFVVSDRVKFITALIYSFNGFIILWGQHYHIATIAVLLPLIAHGYELLLKKNKGILLVFAIFLTALYSIYFLFMSSLFLFIYAIFRYWDIGKKNVQSFLIHLSKSILCYLLGLGLSSIIFLPSLWLLLSSPRIGGDSFKVPLFKLDSLQYYVTAILRLFNNNGVGPGCDYYGSLNYYEAPTLYSGILSLFLLPFFFKGLDRRRKKIYFSLLILFIVFLTIPYFSAMFNAFSAITYRWTFMINFLIIAAAAKGFEYYLHNNFIKTSQYTGVGLIILILSALSCGYFLTPKLRPYILVPAQNMIIPVVFILIYMFIFMFSKFKKHCVPALISILIIELIVLSYSSVFEHRNIVKSNYFRERTGYNDYTNEVVKYLKTQDDSVYRIEKNYDSQFFNDSLVQNYYGIKSYNSLNQHSTLEFLTKMEVPFYVHINYIKNFNNRHTLEELSGVKYYLIKANQKPPRGYSEINKIGDITIYKNNQYLPLGFSYDKYISEADFFTLPQKERDLVMLKAIVIRDSKETKTLNKLEKPYITNEDYSEDIADRKFEALNLYTFKNGKIKGTIDIKNKDKTLFLSIPYDKGWQAKVNGKACKTIKGNLGFIALDIPKGQSTVELEYKQPLLTQGFILSLLTLVSIPILRYRKMI